MFTKPKKAMLDFTYTKMFQYLKTSEKFMEEYIDVQMMHVQLKLKGTCPLKLKGKLCISVGLVDCGYPRVKLYHAD